MADIQQLKRQQDILDTSEKELREAIKPFLEGFLSELDEFVQAAQKASLRGVKRTKQSQNESDLLHATITLNDQDLEIVSNFQLCRLGFNSENVSRILVYPAHNTVEPFFDVIIQPSKNGKFECYARSLFQDEPRPKGIPHPLAPEAGREMAKALLDSIYGLVTVWEPKPDIQSLLDGGFKRPLGFNPRSPG
jgi:hypothetical protein